MRAWVVLLGLLAVAVPAVGVAQETIELRLQRTDRDHIFTVLYARNKPWLFVWDYACENPAKRTGSQDYLCSHMSQVYYDSVSRNFWTAGVSSDDPQTITVIPMNRPYRLIQPPKRVPPEAPDAP